MLAPHPHTPRLDRNTLRERLQSLSAVDLLVIGGGATGLGIALDAASRGWQVALLEAHDFAQGTSSRSTKLVHGGVRYLAQGRLGLVREALHERATLLAQAPHLAQPLPFVMPGFAHWEAPFYGLGLQAYDWLAGSRSLGRTEWLSSRQVRELLPGVRPHGLHGGVRYWDAQFDDARLAITLARTAWQHGAAVLNHCTVTGLLHEQARVVGVQARDEVRGDTFELRARCVINATGVWVDTLRQMDAPQTPPMVSPSQGVHLVVDAELLGSHHALLVPRTADGRVLFAVPWLGKVLLGTTDTPRPDVPWEPAPFEAEIDFILREAGRYLQRAPQRDDVRSLWVGLRPLVKPAQQGQGEQGNTGALSREHAVRLSPSGLVTVTGGKWTTYRAMAADVLHQCQRAGMLPPTPAPATLPRWVGAPDQAHTSLSRAPSASLYGTEAAQLNALPGADHWLAPGLSEAMVRFAVRYEMAQRLDDVLARRSRLLMLDAQRAHQVAASVAQIMSQERDTPVSATEVTAFCVLAQRYRGLTPP